jgi:hypothetical protein
MGMGVSYANLGHSNPNWKLGEPAVMKQLTIHLIEGKLGFMYLSPVLPDLLFR